MSPPLPGPGVPDHHSRLMYDHLVGLPLLYKFQLRKGDKESMVCTFAASGEKGQIAANHSLQIFGQDLCLTIVVNVAHNWLTCLSVLFPFIRFLHSDEKHFSFHMVLWRKLGQFPYGCHLVANGAMYRPYHRKGAGFTKEPRLPYSMEVGWAAVKCCDGSLRSKWSHLWC